MATIKGKRRWNDVVYCDWQAQHTEYQVNFKSNGIQFAELYLDWTTGFHGLTYVTGERQYFKVGRSANEGDDFYTVEKAYRIMDFGETEQLINDELYDFIVANAAEYYTVADKALKIAENVRRVYEAGKAQGHGEGYDSGYDAGLEAGKELGGYNEGYDEGYGKGYSQSESDFWDIVQQSGRRTAYDTAFCWWDSEYLHPKYKVVPAYNGGAKNMIYRCDNLKKVEAAYFDLSQLPNPMSTNGGLAYLFGLCNALEEIEDVGIQPCYSLESFCYSDPKLKKVAVVRVADSTIVKNMLYHCPELEDVTIEGTIGQSGINLQHSKKLSKASIISFINALSDTAVGQSITFSKVAVDREFEDDMRPNAGSDSQDWEYLTTWKQNWTFTLV